MIIKNSVIDVLSTSLFFDIPFIKVQNYKTTPVNVSLNGIYLDTAYPGQYIYLHNGFNVGDSLSFDSENILLEDIWNRNFIIM